MTTTDAVVVGGGLVGTAIARELARAGVSVELVEHQFVGAGSTGAAMGHLVVMDDSPAQIALCSYSRERWREWFDELPDDVQRQDSGTVWVASGERELEHARAKVAAFADYGVAAEVLDSDSLRRAEPALRPGLAGGLLVQGDMVCYPPAVARALVAGAEHAGARRRHGNAVNVSPGRVVLADGTVLSAGAIVIAAGAESGQLVPGLPVVPRRGHLAITADISLVVHHQLVELGYLDTAHSLGGASVAFNVQPRATGQLLIGSSRELVGFDPKVNRGLVARMLSRAVEFLPELARQPVLRTWLGYRPATADSLPLIGPWNDLPGVWIATGHEGLGITMAPGTAALITALITGTTPPIDAAPYRTDRPGVMALAAS